MINGNNSAYQTNSLDKPLFAQYLLVKSTIIAKKEVDIMGDWGYTMPDDTELDGLIVENLEEELMTMYRRYENLLEFGKTKEAADLKEYIETLESDIGTLSNGS